MKRTVKISILILAMLAIFMRMPTPSVLAVERENSLEINVDGSMYYGEVTDYHLSDSYRFTLEESGRIAINLTAKMQYFECFIYDEQGEKLWQSSLRREWDETTEQSNFNLIMDLVQGTYYFVAGKEAWNDNEGRYSFKISFESAEESFAEVAPGSNNSFATANAIDMDTNYNGQIAENDGKDFYKFDLDVSGRLTIKATARMNRIHYALYDEAGNEVWNIFPEYNGTTEESNYSTTLDLIQGCYYFVAEEVSWSGGTGNYSFGLSFSSAEESFAETNTETNNSFYTASNISLDIDYNGQIAQNDEKDFYKFQVQSAGKIHFGAVARMENIRYIIYDNSGKEIWNEAYDWNNVTRESNVDITLELKTGDYYFVVEKRWSTGNYSFIFSKLIPAPFISSVTNTSSGVKLKWENVPNASGYYVYRKIGSGAWKKVKTVSSLSWTDTGAKKNNTKYQYKVCAYDEDGKGLDSAVNATYYLTVPEISGVKNTAAGKISVNWNKNNSATGYQVKYVTGSTSKTVTISNKKTVQKAISGLKKGKTYKVYVRSYKTVSGVKYYSAWSKEKSIKISK